MSFVDFLSHLFTKQTHNQSINEVANYPSKKPTTIAFLYNKNRFFKKPTQVTLSQLKHTYYLNEGHRDKEFFLADSAPFVDLFDEIQNNPNCSFATQINNEIKKRQIPEQISVLKIDSIINERPNLNQVACKILNYFCIPTAYYIDCLNPISKKTEMLTPNFIKDNEELITFDKPETNKKHITLENVLKAYNNVCENLYMNTPKPTNYKEQQIQNYETLTKMYLVRKWLITDDDFVYKNMGIIYNNQTHEITIAPAFDLEYSLETPISNEYYDEIGLSYTDLEFANKHFPQIVDDFISTSNSLVHKTLTQKSPLERMFNSSNITTENKNHFSRLIHKNLSILTQHNNEIKARNSETETQQTI